jgi:tRNA/tmRNA/rRNA uracil-C5-methylase (TrmA/RlmC/RlmD family)
LAIFKIFCYTNTLSSSWIFSQINLLTGYGLQKKLSVIIQLPTNNEPPKILNLFGYSGLASLHAAYNGASVTHVDASKKAINYAFENRNLSSLQQSTY